MRQLFVVAPLSLACCADSPSAPPSGPSISVTDLACNDPACGATLDFALDLETIDPWGNTVPQGTGLSIARYGSDDMLTWVGACAPGYNELGLTFRDFVAGTAPLPEGLVEPTQVSLPFACVAEQDVRIDYAVELATLRQAPGLATIAFSDVTCTVAHRCEADTVAADITCTRPNGDGLGLTLGLSRARIDCGFTRLAVPVDGSAAAPELGIAAIDAGFVAGLETQRWSVTASPTDLESCTLSATITAAPELIGGHAPACTGWPAIVLELPLATRACAASTPTSVTWDDHGPASVVVDARGPHAPAAGPAASCTSNVGSGVAADPSAHGYFDLALEVRSPGD